MSHAIYACTLNKSKCRGVILSVRSDLPESSIFGDYTCDFASNTMF